MPARRHRAPKCNHLGFGAHCHRCAQANALDAKIAKSPNDGNVTGWRAEAERLRAPAGTRPVAPLPKVTSGYGDTSEDIY